MQAEAASGPAGSVSAKGPAAISAEFLGEVGERIAAGKRLRRALPMGGRLHIDRQLPFLCVYRRTRADDLDGGTEALVMGAASYLIASGDRRQQGGLTQLVACIARALQEAFGSFLLVEIWSASDSDASGPMAANTHPPGFGLIVPKKNSLGGTIAAFEQGFQEINLQALPAQVEVISGRKACPPNLPSLLQPKSAQQMGCHVLGVEIKPIFRDPATGKLLPLVHQALRRRFSHALQRGLFDFTRRHTTHRPPHYHALGPRAMVKAVWDADSKLAKISAGFDLLLATTPINAESAWSEFRRRHFDHAPEFTYRPLPMDPALLKRALYEVPIERIEDPTLAHLFREQQIDIDRKISMLSDRGTTKFLYGSLQLFGRVEDALLRVAEEILEKLPARRRGRAQAGTADAAMFAVRAEEELRYMRLTYNDLKCRVVIREDVVGLIVSRGDLLVGRGLKLPAARIPALIAHEIGTHVLTYYNGRAQPFRQLYVGLPGYEELQEGLAVFAEYLVGGLDAARLRLLAARVVAVRRLIEGASFVETFRELNGTHRLSQKAAFNVTLRVFRGGGLTKDAVYLQGLLKLLEYLRNGGQLDPLFVGKFAVEHTPIIRELQLRHVLGPPPLRPSYLSEPEALRRLERAREGMSVVRLVSRRKP